jgi:hypothetical protein
MLARSHRHSTGSIVTEFCIDCWRYISIAIHPNGAYFYFLQPWPFGGAARLVGESTAAATRYPGTVDSVETPGEVAKLAPRDERPTGDPGSKAGRPSATYRAAFKVQQTFIQPNCKT